MAFDELHEEDATGWKRGLYEDAKDTFRAPVVNALFRFPMAQYPDFLRYAWGQVKPIFQTEAFGQFTVTYRDLLLSGLEDEVGLPTFTPGELGMPPGEFRELQGQAATFDIVAPRLAALMELYDTTVHGRPVGSTPSTDLSAVAPLSPTFDRERGLPTTLLTVEEMPQSLSEVADDVRAFHGFDEGLATVHLSLAQWPEYFAPAWNHLEGFLRSQAYDSLREREEQCVEDFLESIPYRPRLSPADLREVGIEEDTIDGVQALFEWFNHGPPRTVIRTLPMYAAMVDADGPRGD